MPGGRPTDYRIEYCDNVIEWGKLGKSRAWIAAELDITVKTLHSWELANPEFLIAMDRSRVKSQQWWEDAGQGGMERQGFGASIWSRSMAARFPDDWREKQTQEHTGAVMVNLTPQDVKVL